MSKDAIYLDYNATSPLRDGVKQVMVDVLGVHGNPSSVHESGREARKLIEEARGFVAKSVGVKPVQVIFTSGGTEANNMALQGKEYGARFCSAIEHDSVVFSKTKPTPIPVDQNGVIDQSALTTNNLEESLVSVMLGNNETGVIQPVANIAALAKGAGATVHTDAVQAFGKIPLDFESLGVDMMTVSAHKVGGPKGIGALIVREGMVLTSLLTGGGQERNRRAGTENLAGIVGFGELAKNMDAVLAESSNIEKLRNKLEAGLGGSTIYSQAAQRLPNTTCVAFPSTIAETQVLKMDLAGFAISAGSACSSGKITPSHVIQAMGFSDEEANQALRISLGWGTTQAHIDSFLQVWSNS